MKIERLSQDKIRIFLTFDDLTERGIQKDDMWREIPKVHELFSEMMDQAYSELGFDPSGPLAVEVFALPAQGMVVIVTKGSSATSIDDEEDDIYELEVTLEQSELISYAFSDFEHLVMAAKAIKRLVDGGVLYHYHSQYVLVIDPEYLDDQDLQLVVAILSEYGGLSVTDAVLGEYGKMIIADRAVEVICRHF